MLTNVLGSLIASIGGSGATGSLVKGGAAGINTALTNTPGFVNTVTPAGNVSAPQAYLTIMFFDERFNFISAADGGVSQAQVAATWSTSTSPLALGMVKAPKNGYVYVYISNRSEQHVYFDDFKVSLQTGNIIEENHYYSFGLKIAAISSKKLGHVNEGLLKNDYFYNDKEPFDDGGLNWYNYGFRNYDPQIGRFPQLDPLTDYYAVLTPYQYAGNDPIVNVDLDGLEPLSSVNGAVSGVTGAARDFTYAYNTASLVLGPAMQAATASSTVFTSINLVTSITSLVATGANIVSDIINSKSVTQQVGSMTKITGNNSAGYKLEQQDDGFDYYTNIDIAAFVWAQKVGGIRGQLENIEWSSKIFSKTVNGIKYYAVTREGRLKDSQFAENQSPGPDANDSYHGALPKGAVLEGHIHYHPLGSGKINESFSPPRGNRSGDFGMMSGFPNLRFYVLGSSGELWGRIPANDKPRSVFPTDHDGGKVYKVADNFYGEGKIKSYIKLTKQLLTPIRLK
ncbi:RHS repeat-associated core domain-containing protein [Agriterribacter sp.]|uniref:RHS repeat-associated core domain-containing protein n=1 Tax=Agriterribacter sp. TaxID=2821509 RepID=UPI002B79A1B8|nr:RHS repeat-associated core domain-containing protein [Agriterribacter sp.]HTN08249.1 RHS repeat-associated core domain-containing protein [Agriterribacter sp.]